MLVGNSSLTKLQLCENKVGISGAHAIGSALAHNRALLVLQLANNPLGDEGVCTIAASLSANMSLMALQLDATGLSDRGCMGLASTLSMHPRLATLQLSQNKITDTGAIRLGTALASARALTALDLSRNGIESAGAEALGEGVRQSATLVVLKLNGNGIGRSGVLHLAEAIASSTSLTELGLDGNAHSEATAFRIGECLERNRLRTEAAKAAGADGAKSCASTAQGLPCNDGVVSIDAAQLYRLREKSIALEDENSRLRARLAEQGARLRLFEANVSRLACDAAGSETNSQLSSLRDREALLSCRVGELERQVMLSAELSSAHAAAQEELHALRCEVLRLAALNGELGGRLMKAERLCVTPVTLTQLRHDYDELLHRHQATLAEVKVLRSQVQESTYSAA